MNQAGSRRVLELLAAQRETARCELDALAASGDDWPALLALRSAWWRRRSLTQPPAPSAIEMATAHALVWLVVGNVVGLLLAGLQLLPGLNLALAPWTYGRWIPVHLNAQLYGWTALPLVGLLLRFFGERQERAWLSRLAASAWSAALAVGCLSWLAGESSGKPFLEWRGAGRWALVAAMALLAVALVAALIAIPAVTWWVTNPEVYPAYNPDSGGATGGSLLGSSLALVVGATFGYFLLFAQFGFLDLLQERLQSAGSAAVALGVHSSPLLLVVSAAIGASGGLTTVAVAAGLRTLVPRPVRATAIALGTIPGWFSVVAGVVLMLAWLTSERGRLARVASLFGTSALLVVAASAVAAVRDSEQNRSHERLASLERGRQVYLSEGCINCHSQYVRCGTRDEQMWGPCGAPDVAESPPLIGNRRLGPDLLNVGNRRSRSWQRLHLEQPRQLSPGSMMPSYRHLFADHRGDALVSFLSSLGADTGEQRFAMTEAQPVPDHGAGGSVAGGKRLFAQYCRACHGSRGRGDGELSPQLAVRRPTAIDLSKGDFWFVSHGPLLSPSTPLFAGDCAPTLGWLGHSGFLLEWCGTTLLIDANLNDRCTLSRRLMPAFIEPDRLPPADAVLLSHAHFDHLDLPTLEAIRAPGAVIAPHGSIRLHPFASGDLAVGYVIRHGGDAIYYAGDTGRGKHFAAIAAAFEPRLAILPIGAYAPRPILRRYHLNPEEAVAVAIELGVEVVVPSHFGTFRLSLDHPRAALPRFAKAAAGDEVTWLMPALVTARGLGERR